MRNALIASHVPDPLDRLDSLVERIWLRAEAVDRMAAFPHEDVADLVESGIVTAIAQRLDAGAMPLLRAIGGASLTVGRLIEGHLNANKLIHVYGHRRNSILLAEEVAAGRISGVWNAERDGGVVATRVPGGYRLDGSKVRCSGAGIVRRPVVTARLNGATLMVLPDMAASGATTDLTVWRAAGMRGTATGDVVFDGVEVADDAVIGNPDDYYRSPWFSGGAWRVIAVQLGGLDRLMALHAGRLKDDAVSRHRFAAAAGAHECARLIVAEAARRAEGDGDAAAIDAYVDLARTTFETAALTIIDATRRNIGLSTFIAPDPLDRCMRDLETYLRQPFLDASRDNSARWLATHGGRFT